MLIVLANNNNATHPNVVPNLYDFISSLEHNRSYFEDFIIIFFTITMNVNCVQNNTAQLILILWAKKKKKKKKKSKYHFSWIG